jgi:hypothetical protein
MQSRGLVLRRGQIHRLRIQAILSDTGFDELERMGIISRDGSLND